VTGKENRELKTFTFIALRRVQRCGDSLFEFTNRDTPIVLVEANNCALRKADA